MLKIVSVEEMQLIEKTTMKQFNISSKSLMEQAGYSLAQRIRSLLPWDQELKLVFVCGYGKNGGDGLVAARYLAEYGLDVSVLLISSSKMADETKENLKLLSSLNINLLKSEKKISDEWLKYIKEADLIVDALLGIGLKGDPKEPFATLIQQINNSLAHVISADVPSGLDADLGRMSTHTVKADFTVTFGLPKRGLFEACIAPAVGQLTVETIGFPEQLIVADQESVQYVDRITAAKLLPKRPVNAHKKNTGKVAIIGGSGAYHGAVLLAARGALRVGSGHVTQAYPEKLNSIIREHALETLCVPLPCNSRCALSKKALQAMNRLTEDKDAVVVGPGMGWEKTTQDLIRVFVATVTNPRAVIIDADALHAIAEDKQCLMTKNAPEFILTPHEGEAAILINKTSAEIRKNRVQAANEIAEKYNCIVVLKGQHTIVKAPGKPVYIVGSGTQALAVAGTGDVLCGMIGSLVAQQLSPLEAAILGVYLHGIAGTLVSPDPFGLGARAGEIADAIPQAIATMRYQPKNYVIAKSEINKTKKRK